MKNFLNRVLLRHQVGSLDHVGTQVEHLLSVFAGHKFNLFCDKRCAIKVLVQHGPLDFLGSLPRELPCILDVDIVLIVVGFVLVRTESLGLKGLCKWRGEILCYILMLRVRMIAGSVDTGTDQIDNLGAVPIIQYLEMKR